MNLEMTIIKNNLVSKLNAINNANVVRMSCNCCYADILKPIKNENLFKAYYFIVSFSGYYNSDGMLLLIICLRNY